MLAAILTCGATMVLTSCSKNDDNPAPTNPGGEADVKIDYSDESNWLKLPKVTKAVDCFYVYPTEYEDDSKGAPMFADIKDMGTRLKIENTYRLQGTAYEDCANVFAPLY